MTTETVTILLVEGDKVDVMAVKCAFKDLQIEMQAGESFIEAISMIEHYWTY
jgi:hypothetical protein